MTFVAVTTLLLACVGSATTADGPAVKADVWAVKAAEVHSGDGQVWSPGVVVVEGGKIVAVGEIAVPAGARVIDGGSGSLTPGLVDAASQLGACRDVGFAEQAAEVIPHLTAADALDLSSPALRRLASEGVTTIYLTPEAGSVIGSQGVAAKTGGAAPRILPAGVAIKANLGPETWQRGSYNRPPAVYWENDFTTRRPLTRMGSVWVFREAFHTARLHQVAGQMDLAPAAMQVLGQVLDGEVGLRFQARYSHDIQSALRLTAEFGIDAFVLEDGCEVHRCLELVQARDVAIIFGPLDRAAQRRRRSTEPLITRLTTPALLHEHGIRFALTAAERSGEAGLARQAGLAIRHGLGRTAALRSVTSTPAALLGIAGRVGTLQVGADADLVLWSQRPLDDQSGVRLVLISGEPVHDPEGLSSPPQEEPS